MLRKLFDVSQKIRSQWLSRTGVNGYHAKWGSKGGDSGYSQIRTDPGKSCTAENPGTKPEKSE